MTNQAVEASERSRYIIGYEGELPPQLTQYTDRIETSFEQINAVVAELSKAEVKKLQQRKEITYVEKDAPVHAMGQVVDWGVKTIGAEAAWNNGLTGKGVKIAILDTGVESSHPDLAIKEGKSFVHYTTSSNDDNGHGTHVAGIIGAQQNDEGTVGVAYDATLYAAKVLDENGDGFVSDVIKAIEWALEKNVDLINLSLTGSRASAALEAMLNRAYERGVLIIAASGNYGKADGSGDTVDFPARYESVIAVAAVDHQSKRASFSGTGSAVEVAAPGVQIYSTYLNGDYAYSSGTSMAAPHVTGHLALLKQAYPHASHEELRELLHQQTVDLSGRGRNAKYGYGRIQIPANLRPEAPRPFAPINITLKQLDWNEDKAQVEVSWEAAQDGVVPSTYTVYRNDEKIAVTDTPTYVDTIGSGTYTYTVDALNEDRKPSKKAKPVTITIKRDKDPIVRPSFSDVKGDEWFTFAIYELVNRNIIQGYPDGSVKPNQTITRAEAAVMMSRALKKDPAPYHGGFVDVRRQNYAADYIQAMVDEGIFYGYGHNSFRPHASIERGEIAAILNRSFALKAEKYIYFPDVPSTYFAYHAIANVAGANVARGTPDGNFHPRASVTRAEFAAFLTRALEFEMKK